jgi:hypothetical protein
VNNFDPTGLADDEGFKLDLIGFISPTIANSQRREPLPSEFVEQQAYMNRAAMGASTIAVAAPVAGLAMAEIGPAAIGEFNGASGAIWEVWLRPGVETAQAWFGKSLWRKAVATVIGFTVAGNKGNVQTQARPWYSTSTNPRAGSVINPRSSVNTILLSSPKPLAPTTGPVVNSTLFPANAGNAGASVSAKLLEGDANTHVYLGMKDGKVVYAGITKDISARQTQHGDRFVLQPLTTDPLIRNQARSIEQVLIEQNPHFENKINSISPSRTWYQDAIDWGSEWLQQNGR